MSLTETAIARPAIAATETVLRIAKRVVAPFAAVLRKLDEAATRDLAIRELDSLPDYMLRDMGIDRNDIRRRVRGLPDDD